ncbi:E3 ubiquitin- ligase RNF170-like isoform X1 [Olea europaea subsp. europaea]|uniref:E3 ubiquitin- ligase RNF170-like isoform X1 n=1 Tax=Olea europaea subsp. europaea TaxID=158383 RepID=A0A8S0RQ35_OLEEU|nr:E3 ubiquitin- ligase RNF170-like isoform X1 [Olea europaea subsp. europaea]
MGNQFGGFRQLPPPGTICPICLSTFIVPCQTNCGHWFCAECILRWSETSRIMKTMNCPKCLALITSIAVDNSASRRFTAINIRIWSYNATFEMNINRNFLKKICSGRFKGNLNTDYIRPGFPG